MAGANDRNATPFDQREPALHRILVQFLFLKGVEKIFFLKREIVFNTLLTVNGSTVRPAAQA